MQACIVMSLNCIPLISTISFDQDDDTGLFVSKLADNGPAKLAGLRVGDKLLRVNNTDVVNVRHQVDLFDVI